MPDAPNSSVAVGSTWSFNGPVCPLCHHSYLGRHECRIPDLQEQINRLQAKIDQLRIAEVTP